MLEYQVEIEKNISSIFNKSVEPHEFDISTINYQQLEINFDGILIINLIKNEIEGVYYFREYLHGTNLIPEYSQFSTLEHLLDYTYESAKEYLESYGRLKKYYED